jgi:hypothetical protein
LLTLQVALEYQKIYGVLLNWRAVFKIRIKSLIGHLAHFWISRLITEIKKTDGHGNTSG